MSGKTTVGEILSEKMKFNFYDTDTIINEDTKYSIKENIERNGEDFFRKKESQVVKQYSSVDSSVISIGGGAANELTISSIKEYTYRVWLKCSISILKKRYTQDEHSRPLLYNTNNIEKTLNQLLIERSNFYFICSNITINADFSSPIELANQILLYINEKN